MYMYIVMYMSLTAFGTIFRITGGFGADVIHQKKIPLVTHSPYNYRNFIDLSWHLHWVWFLMSPMSGMMKTSPGPECFPTL
jgi:hypothetical protein